MKLVAFIQMYNEVTKGNLEHCLTNCKRWADDIVIYDDCSTDSSVEVASKFTKHIIRGTINCITHELAHKQQLLEYALTLNPDWIFWVDCDETLNRFGTEGGLRALCDNSGADAYSFKEVNLWRGRRWIRKDSLFDSGWFVRLWRVTPGIKFNVLEGVHKRLYPMTIDHNKVIRAMEVQVIHYGFWYYPACLVKVGAHLWDKEAWLRSAPDNWILNETDCRCIKAPDSLYPIEDIPPDDVPEPKPKLITELKTYKEIIDEQNKDC